MKSLYVETRNRVLITANDSHLIIISADHRLNTILPSELNSVTIKGRALIDSRAIFLLNRYNVAISLIEENGRQDALILPYNHCLSFHYREQRIILKSTNNLERYMKWIEIQRMIQQMSVIKRFSPGIKLGNDLGEGNYQFWLRRIQPVDERLWMIVKNTVRNLIKNLIAGKIIRAGLDIHFGGYFRRANYGLLLDFLFIIEPRADEQSLLFFKQKNWKNLIQRNGFNDYSLLEDGFHNIVHRFENKKARLSDIVDLIIDDYFALIRELKT